MCKSNQTTYTNSKVSANNINITTNEDMNVKGANVTANETINLDIGKDLNVVAVQDRTRSDSKSMGINLSYSAGNGSERNASMKAKDSRSSGSVGFNIANSKYQNKQTVDTVIIGKIVNAKVENETYLQGATLASLDNNGNDNNKLTLNTKTLKYEDLSNTTYSNNKSMGASVDWSTKTDKKGVISKSSDSSSLQYSNGIALSKDKTLSTLGEGDITVANVEESSDLERLNRDVSNTTKEIYSVNRQKGNIDVKVDHRVFTEEGRNSIIEDSTRLDLITDAIIDVANSKNSSLKFTDTFEHIENVQKNLDVMKKVSISEDGKYAKVLNNLDTSSVEEKQQALEVYSQAISDIYGVSIESAQIIAFNKIVAGATYSKDNTSNNIFVNDDAQNNAKDYVNTITHEGTHVLENQGAIRKRGSEVLSEQYESYTPGVESPLLLQSVIFQVSSFLFIYNFQYINKKGYHANTTKNGFCWLSSYYK